VYILYNLLLLLGFLVYAPFYAIRARRAGKGGLNLRARLGLGLPARTSERPCLWVHAVSVGEVLSLRNLLREIRKKHPAWEIHCSTLTSTGRAVAAEKLAGAASIFYAPLDFGLAVNRFFRALRPDLFVLVESEFWPNLIQTAKRRAGAVLLINGRISDRSFRRYLWAKPFARRVLNCIDRFLVQTDLDRTRLLELGVEGQQVEVAGNLKSDVRLPVFTPDEQAELRRKIGLQADTRVIVAGSTHRGEEEVLLEAFCESRKRRKNIGLVIAPRHTHRTEEVQRLARDFGLEVMRKTEAAPEKTWDVLVLDTMGELSSFYARGDLAFMGGSLVPRGGQNLLEPAFYGKPIAFGPGMHNFAFLAEEFLRHGAATLVFSRKELAEFFLREDEQALEEMGKRARALLLSLQGATEKTLRVIESLMPGSSPAIPRG